MHGDEPLSLRTVIGTTLVSIIAFLLLVYITKGAVASSWIVAGVLNVSLFVLAGVVLQVRHWRGLRSTGQTSAVE